MTISNDDVRREARDIQADHEDSLPSLREALARLFDQGNGVSADGKATAVLGRLGRRRLLQVGGLTVAGAAILAACGSDDDDTGAATTAAPATTAAATTAAATTTAPAATTTTAAAAMGDVVILRTASSIEELAVAAYQTAIDSGLVTTPAVGDAAKLFQAQHREHSGLFQAATKEAGGEPFTQPNPAILKALEPAIAALKDEAGVLALAYDLEVVAAQTYQSNVGNFEDAALNAAIMSVGGVEARHAALLAAVLMRPSVPAAFQVTAMAVEPGTGV